MGTAIRVSSGMERGKETRHCHSATALRSLLASKGSADRAETLRLLKDARQRYCR